MPRRRPGSLADLPPLKITRKIILLQLSYYACAALMLLFATQVAGHAFSVDLLFGWQSIRGDTSIGWIFSFVWLLNSLPSAISLLVFIARSKLILDFALTIHFIHVVVTSLYSHSVPANLLWWSIQIASAIITVFLGIWACQWRELQPVAFFGATAASTANTTRSGSSTDRTAPDQPSRPSNSINNGHGAEGDYEMTTLKTDSNSPDRPA